jgi:hypothetical protein
VLNFRLVTGDQPGDYPITIEDAIIGNEDSQNILTGTGNGNIFMPGSFIPSNPASLIGVTLYPNPFSTELSIDIELIRPGYYELTLISSNGLTIYHDIIYLTHGTTHLMLHNLYELAVPSTGIYFLILREEGHNRQKTFKIVKMK